jgi:23S rRNA (guanosine2251-2'-O)-methyltransferase
MAPAAGNANAPSLIFGLHAVREALVSGSRPLLRLHVLRDDRQFAALVKLARTAHVIVHIEPQAALDRLVPGGRHQGVVAFVAAKRYSDQGEILGYAREKREAPFIVILDGVEDPHNLGAVCRTAEAAGVHGVFIPDRRSVGITGAVAKASAGALEYLRIGCVTNISRLIESLQAEGIWIYALTPSASLSYARLDLKGPLALVFGGEGKGIRPGVLEKCDGQAHIPMRGQIESLNVSAAAAVVLFEAVRQRLG